VSHRATPSGRADGGQVSLLLLGYALIVIALVFTAASATQVHLARHRLQAVADGAALDAADALDRQRFYVEVGGAGPAPDRAVPVSTASVRSSVGAYLAAAPDAGGLDGVQPGEPTGSPDGSTAEVTLTSRVRMPLLSAVLGRGGLTIRVTSRARARRLG
jgi:Putative Flp pilus-assembly TadE/G-like